MEQFDWVGVISNVGFPIFITIYLLARLEKSFQQLENIVKELIDEIKKRETK
ncbi:MULTISPECIES: YvrJ family protein [Aneurinibacillus]|uniref:YvrJ family protein n=1 Tax=Aneurinibacillus thermoaerophilus TaxID=143495 RepID=A0A1G8FLY0_ANETH|nr:MULTISPECIES: YvrJ family protein [Aneurinibacillus]MED0674471.1 YvrJ family protein [Aneurinibacillus thermoaerophilus]MED0678489.1 YvrJ family protein [Aneurinibacillus thermoaerophilus]MED0735986.1 YvrJ family protein [Aneurinibacillus thermoaerophilus]MED0759077.1 YvrJ family protein [Aneurinibacillus thermoaerophilus]MED0761788.1 YvrJ family protein [Aneurinibacillus thermoaerophilus]